MGQIAVHIRLAEPHDALAIAQMSRDNIEAGLGWSWRPQRVMTSIRDPQALCVVASATQVLGFCITQFGDESGHLSLLAVDPSMRRRGLGTRLVKWMLKSARVAGLAVIHVEMRARNSAARAFYSALDFEHVGQVSGYYRGVEAAERMLLRLRPEGLEPMVWELPASWRGTGSSS
jgi:ribosomal-protein-alanine N-acetyltransferase